MALPPYNDIVEWYVSNTAIQNAERIYIYIYIYIYIKVIRPLYNFSGFLRKEIDYNFLNYLRNKMWSFMTFSCYQLQGNAYW